MAYCRICDSASRRALACVLEGAVHSTTAVVLAPARKGPLQFNPTCNRFRCTRVPAHMELWGLGCSAECALRCLLLPVIKLQAKTRHQGLPRPCACIVCLVVRTSRHVVGRLRLLAPPDLGCMRDGCPYISSYAGCTTSCCWWQVDAHVLRFSTCSVEWPKPLGASFVGPHGETPPPYSASTKFWKGVHFRMSDLRAEQCT
jgi:hypothetical protein